jgi:ABC-2 type transport system ATP-binding protein
MMIQANQLWRRFGRFDALRGLSVSVPEGSAFALIGANGAGKTTTIKVLMNILQPSCGTAMVLGVDSRRLSPHQLSQIGYVSENQDMPGRLSVTEYLDYLRPFYPRWDRGIEGTVLRQLQLPSQCRIRDLSHGMRMKMALACALPFSPKLLILDEPFSGLDPLVRDEFMEGVLQRAGEFTILISSHELSEIEGVATHVGFLHEGRILFQESMGDLVRRFKEVQVTLDQQAAVPDRLPASWLNARAVGNVLSFVDTRFSEDTQALIHSLLVGVQRVETQPMPLRSIFTALAPAARDGVV